MFLLDSQTIIYFIQRKSKSLPTWVEQNLVFVTDVSKTETIDDFQVCIAQKADLNYSQIQSYQIELQELEDYFFYQKMQNRYIKTTDNSAILQRAQVLNTNGIGKTIGLADCTLAAAAEVLHYTLVTCDNDLITKLLKENETNAGNFQLLPYTFETMEQDFKQWNE